MSTIAFIGLDGAGKTTITERLLADLPGPAVRIYMGTSLMSANVTLPTARLVLWLKRRSYRKTAARSQDVPLEPVFNRQLEQQPGERGTLGLIARTFHRLAEEWYRQLVVWSYELRGYTVLFDRHFVYEYAEQNRPEAWRRLPWPDRLHLWCLNHLYPQPGLVIFLDAPPALLLKRKEEGLSVAELEAFREAMLAQGSNAPNFVEVDASQPLETVYTAVWAHVEAFLGLGTKRSEKAQGPNPPAA